MYYNPWIAENYRSGKGKYGQLLVLAEPNFRIADTNPNIVVHSINNLLCDADISQHTMLTEIGGMVNPENYTELYFNCAFCFLPRIVSKAERLSRSYKEVFFSILDSLAPNKLLVISENKSDIYHNLHPCSHHHCRPNERSRIKSGSIQHFRYSSGSCDALFMNHSVEKSVRVHLMKAFLEG